MVNTFVNMVKDFWKNWLTVVLFITGLSLITIAAFMFNQVLGMAVSGSFCVLVACILVKEGR
ncbi:hypothetical protein IV55_GL000713 [Furfurilactobacillus siliginis]|uniref:DUF1056 domain-containing protein n=1 Tax=Furfurilactobacillus siliginis TaxID=348151 RepID=A0A0R2LE41_9LACO|nr:hypothetical protein IV55_GL000713 [Furfurilactobacillus siliginis]GEK28512.1 hypothetical protein LSI01_08230 [Furfurilactobacillus siliginis]